MEQHGWTWKQWRWVVIALVVVVFFWWSGLLHAEASTGAMALDAAYTDVDGAIGATGAILFKAALCAFIIMLCMGHYALGFGIAVCAFIAGAMVGQRESLAGLVGLTEAATLDQPVVAVDAPAVPVQPLAGIVVVFP